MPITTPGIVPIWEDHLSHIVPIADIKAWYNYTPGLQGDPLYFQEGTFNRGGIPKITTGSEFMIPEKGPALVSAYSETITIEPNDQNFYAKQDTLFSQESKLMQDWLYAIEHKEHTPVTKASVDEYSLTPFVESPIDEQTTYVLGPYIDLSLQSESNKYYGISDSRKSAWLQRSLTRGVNIIVNSKVMWADPELDHTQEAKWYPTILKRFIQGAAFSPPGSDIDDEIATPAAITIMSGMTYAALIAQGPGIGATTLGQYLTSINVTDNTPSYAQTTDSTAGIIPGTRTIELEYNSAFYYIHIVFRMMGSDEETPVVDNDITTTTGGPVYIKYGDKEQRFYANKTTYTYYPTCTYKQLGFTKIKGHGHYTL